MPRPLHPVLARVVARGLMSEAQARDVDAFADGVLERVRSGEITREQGDELVQAQAIRDALAFKRARAAGAPAPAASNRAARRAEAAKQRKRR